MDLGGSGVSEFSCWALIMGSYRVPKRIPARFKKGFFKANKAKTAKMGLRNPRPTQLASPEAYALAASSLVEIPESLIPLK